MSLRFAVILMYVLASSGVALVRPFVGLLALVAMYYFRPDIWTQPPWFRPQLWLTASIAIGWALSAKSIKVTPVMLAGFLATGTLFVGSFTAVDDTEIAYFGAVVVLKLALVMFLTLNLVNSTERVRQFLWANIIGMLWNLKSIIVTGLRGGEVTEQRVDIGVGQGGGANYIAMVLVAAIPFLMVRAQEGTTRERFWSKVLLIPHVVALILTGSRAGFLAFGAVLLWTTLRSKRKLGAFVMAGALGIVFLLVVPDSFIERFQSGVGQDGARDSSAQTRLVLWKGATQMFLERPLTGVGMDNYPLLSPRYVGFYAGRTAMPYQPGVKGPGFVTHSTWFQTIAEGGLLTAVPFIGMIILAWFCTMRVKGSSLVSKAADQLRAHATAMQGMLIGIVITSTFGSHMKIDFLWWYAGLASALVLIMEQERRAARILEASRVTAVPSPELATSVNS